jgi:dihydrofolate synthase/folylpolyglutamate synthase
MAAGRREQTDRGVRSPRPARATALRSGSPSKSRPRKAAAGRHVGEPRILLDGAHNPEGAATLAAALQSVYTYRKLHMMVGMLSTKNHTGYLRHILPLVDTLIITEPDFHKKGDASMLAGIASELLREMNRTVDIIVERDWKLALETLTSRTEQDDLAVVSGTLYLISDVRSWITYQTDSEKGW